MSGRKDIEVLMRRLVAKPETAVDDLPLLMGRIDAWISSQEAQGPFEAIAGDLVCDLTHYEPDPETRAGDTLFFGEAKAVLIVADALGRLEGLRAG